MSSRGSFFLALSQFARISSFRSPAHSLTNLRALGSRPPASTSIGRNLGDHISCDPAQSTPSWVEEELLSWPFTNQRGRRAERACFASRGSGVRVPLAPLSVFRYLASQTLLIPVLHVSPALAARVPQSGWEEFGRSARRDPHPAHGAGRDWKNGASSRFSTRSTASIGDAPAVRSRAWHRPRRWAAEVAAHRRGADGNPGPLTGAGLPPAPHTAPDVPCGAARRPRGRHGPGSTLRLRC